MPTFAALVKNIFLLFIVLQLAPPLVRNLHRHYRTLSETRTKVGLLNITGSICHSKSTVKTIEKFFTNDDIKAIVLVIECPGGAAGSAEAIAHEILLHKKEHPKPIICLAENCCASGGYYIAACADYIITSPSCLVGSIGTTLPYQFRLKEFIEQFKIHYDPIYSGENKLLTDPLADRSPEHKKALQAIVQSSYTNFISHINHCRPQLSLDTHATWANGNIFTGRQALQLQLIDQIGSWSDAIKKLKEVALIDGTIEWIKPSKKKSWWRLFSNTQNDQDHATCATTAFNNTIPDHTIVACLRQLVGILLGDHGPFGLA